MCAVKVLSKIEEFKNCLDQNFTLQDELQNITLLASETCKKPISLITFFDGKESSIAAATGINEDFLTKKGSFCKYTLQNESLFVIPDATTDSRFHNDTLVHESPNVRFYAGVPLVTSDGLHLGTICLFDLQPSDLDDVQSKTLQVLSRQVIFLLEAELSKKQLEKQLEELEQKNNSLRAIAQLQSHDIRQPLTSIIGLLNLADDEILRLDGEWLTMIRNTAKVLDNRIHAIVNESMGNKDIKLIRFNKMVEEIEDYAILLLDPNGVIENWNIGARKIKGYKAKEIVGRNFNVFYTIEQQQENIPEHLLEIAKKEGIARDEGLRVKKDGTTFKARVIITAIHDELGEIIGFTKVTRDISNE